MQIKSWQIALISAIIQFIPLALEFSLSFLIKIGLIDFKLLTEIVNILYIGTGKGGADPGLAATMLVVFSAITFILASIATIILYFNKTKKIGVVFSIIFGIFSILLVGLARSGQIVGIFLIFAGIYYFWKERKISEFQNKNKHIIDSIMIIVGMTLVFVLFLEFFGNFLGNKPSNFRESPIIEPTIDQSGKYISSPRSFEVFFS